MNNFYVIDNFVSDSLSDHLDNLFHMGIFPWFYHGGTIPGQIHGDSPQFVHCFFENSTIESNFYHEVSPIVALAEKHFNIDVDSVIRVKSNLLYKNNLEFHHPLHKDGYSGDLSLIYYVNNSDGDTVLYSPTDGKCNISPKKGRLLVFPSDWDHASSSPLVHNTRIVLNYVLKPRIMPNDSIPLKNE